MLKLHTIYAYCKFNNHSKYANDDKNRQLEIKLIIYY